MPMPDIGRLSDFCRLAPAGTLVPVESLREMLGGAPPSTANDDPALTLEQAAERIARGLAMRTPTAAGVRKWITKGYRGVKLEAFEAGRGYSVLTSAADRFIAARQATRGTRAGQAGRSPDNPPRTSISVGAPRPAQRPTTYADPADEISQWEAAGDRARKAA